MDAFELLDHNCWRLIFRKLDAVDHISTRLVCTSFYFLLEEKPFQDKRKFHLVLPLLFPYLKLTNHHWGGMSWRILYKIRLLSKSWCQSVDKYVSEIYEPASSRELRLSYYPLATSFNRIREIEAFHHQFGGYNGNPFPARRVHIKNFSSVKSYVVYIQNITNFMERFGKDILQLELDFSLRYHNTGYLFICRLIKAISMHLPNLKTLLIKCSDYDLYNGQRTRDSPQQMATWIGRNALPDLPKLRALVINGMGDAVEDYLVRKYAIQLTHFRRTSNRYQLPQQLPQQLNPQLFPNLRKLVLEILDHSNTLEPLQFLQSPLKVIKLIIRFEQNEPFWNVDVALRNLKHLPLECLKIRAYQNVNLAEADLNLEDYINESIQTLSIHFGYLFDHHWISYNFLQALTKLEKLKLKYGQTVIAHPQHLQEEVELNEYLEMGEDMPYHSNIWEKVPSLKTLTMKRDLITNWGNGSDRSTYSREKYERYAWEHDK